MMSFAESFTVYSRTIDGEDADGNDAYNETTRVVRGAFAPAGSVEQVQGAAQVTTHDTLYLDAGYAAPGPHDEMLVRGTRRQVDGTPGEYRSPFTGWTPGAVVKLVTVNG